MLWIYRNWRRKRLAKRPLPDGWREAVEEELAWFADYDETEQERFLIHLKVFALEKHWIGAAGLEVTDEMKIMISGAAARLSHNIDLHVYDRLTEIVIYPSHYKHPDKDDHTAIYGEAHHFGTVVLSWDAVRRGISVPNDGHDTALHEFAHVLDIGDGAFDGTPELGLSGDYRGWASVLSRHYLDMQERPGRSVLREYGATNEAEFFAVATETFFEKPTVLKRKAPDLYDTLARYYNTNPEAPDLNQR